MENNIVSDCHEATIKWDVDTYNTYTQAYGEGKGFICQKCNKPCNPKEREEQNELQRL